MTRADEIADEFEAPLDERPDREAALGHEAIPHAEGRQHGPAHLSGHIHLPHGHPAAEEVAEREREDVSAPDDAGDVSESDAVADGSSASPRAERTGASEDAPVEAPAADPPGPDADKTVHTPQHETLPNIARAAAGGILQAAGWTAGTSLRVSNQLRRLAADPLSAQEVIDEVTREVREVARDFLGITELEGEVREMAPLLSSGLLKAGGASPDALRAQGEVLLRAAADVGFDESAHPAFARILTELSPDEARILRLLAIEGAQPMVDVRASNLIGNGSQLIAQSLNMLGPKAGLRQRERVPVYLTNLTRLSLVLLSDEPLESPVEYQVLEAQPEVLATLRDTVRAKTIRRSIALTPLGQEFCDVCLPVQLPQLPPPSNR